MLGAYALPGAAHCRRYIARHAFAKGVCFLDRGQGIDPGFLGQGYVITGLQSLGKTLLAQSHGAAYVVSQLIAFAAAFAPVGLELALPLGGALLHLSLPTA